MPFVVLEGLRKSFGGIQAVVHGNLAISRPGVVHALMGANGSGKSTTLKILSGQIRPDSGRICLRGEQVDFRDPHDAVRAGVSMVAQETAIAPSLSITENVLMGRLERTAGRKVNWSASHEHATAVIYPIGLHVDPRTPVGELRPDQKQLVEIARAVSRDSKVVILDEPTSSLADDRVEDLYAVIRQLTANGVSIVLVSHRLSEVFTLADELTVMRDGSSITAGPVADFDTETLVAAMSGHGTSIARTGEHKAAVSQRAPALSVRSLTVPATLDSVDVDVRPGEIVGIAGLEGSGRGALLEAIFGHAKVSAGAVTVGGHDLPIGRVRASIAAGIAYLPPDRKIQGLALALSSVDNLALPMTGRALRLRGRSRRAEHAFYDLTRAAMRLRSASPFTAVNTLSGGNQQKIAIGKWLGTRPSVLLLDEPTRGVDVVAKQEIHQRLRLLADEGAAILVSSSENDELMELADRIVVLFRGRAVGTLTRDQFADSSLNALAGGHQ